MELHAIPTNLIPSNPHVGAVVTTDGVTLRYARWRPTSRKKRGTVMIVQGRAECIEKYFEFVVELRRRGFHVVAFDLRGQGGSERLLDDPRKGHVDSFDEYVADIDAVTKQVMQADMPAPYFAVGHSMGAASLLLAMERGKSAFERVVLMAPLIRLAKVPLQGLARATASVFDFFALGGSYVPGGGATCVSTRPFSGNRLTSDPIRYQVMADVVATHQQLGLGDPTIRWALAMFDASDRFFSPDFGRRLATPTLMMLPGADPLCSSPAAEELASRMRACQMVLIPGARHEILMERDGFRQQFFAAFDAFIPGESHEDDLASELEPERQKEPLRSTA